MSNIFDLFKQIEKKPDTSPVTHIVAGLGNIGKQYEKTRHNAGFLAVDFIAERAGVKIDRVKFHSTVAEASIAGRRVLLMKPTTLMNNSGVAVRMFEALQGKRINIQMISSSEIKLSVVIAEEQADQAVTAIHDQFFQD